MKTHDAGASRFYVGIDGGGTKTMTVVVNNQGVEVARYTAPTSNPAVVGFERSLQVLTSSVSAVATLLDVSLPFASGWIGLAGFDRPGDRERLTPGLAKCLTETRLSNDGELVLAGLPDRIGVAVIAGTGSIALGRSADGMRARAGGWGHIIGDEGSGWALGTYALRAIAAEVDGRGPETPLTALVVDTWELDDPRQIVTRTYDPATSKSDIAHLAELTLHVAENGDSGATHAVVIEANALADQVLAVANRLAFIDSIPLSLSGGLLLNNPFYRTHLLNAIASYRAIGTIASVQDPALSAARSVAMHAQETGSK